MIVCGEKEMPVRQTSQILALACPTDLAVFGFIRHTNPFYCYLAGYSVCDRLMILAKGPAPQLVYRLLNHLMLLHDRQKEGQFKILASACIITKRKSPFQVTSVCKAR